MGGWKRATLTLEHVTPCFLGGSDNQGGAAEWRASSIRGQLRWWFRAVAGGTFQGDLDKVRKAEDRIFGSTGRSSTLRIEADQRSEPSGVEGTGFLQGSGDRLDGGELAGHWGYYPQDEDYSSIQRILEVTYRDRGNGATRTVKTHPFQYLGYGCFPAKGTARSFFCPGSANRIVLGWNETRWQLLDDVTRELFGKALWTWLHLGGIGGRWRNGFGSLALTGLEGSLPSGSDQSLETLSPSESQFKEISGRLLAAVAKSSEPARWTHFTASARLYASDRSHRSWDQALTDAAAWLIAFRRRYGVKNDPRKYQGVSIAGRDYEWAAPKGTKRLAGYPDRSGFGLPLPFGQGGETVTWAPAGERPGPKSKDRRRASPLLLHIARFGHSYKPVFTYLPASFLPPESELRFKDKATAGTALRSEQKEIIPTFLADLESRNLVARIHP